MDLPDQVAVATLDTLGFVPDNKDSLNSFIDIKVHESGLEQFQDGTLEGHSLSEYLTRVASRPIHGYRIILSIDRNKPHNCVSWSRSDFEAILKTFKLPGRVTKCLADWVPLSRVRLSSSIVDESQTAALCYIFESGPNTEPEWLACGSWELKTRETRAFVRISIQSHRQDKGELEEAKQCFIDLLQQSSKVATHPLSLLVALREQDVKRLSALEVDLGIEMDGLERDTGQSPLGPFPVANESQQAANLAGVLNDLNKHNSLAAVEEKNAHVTRKSLLDLHDGLTKLGQMQCFPECDHNLLLDQTDVLLNAVERKTLHLQGLQKRGQVQLSYVYNALALQETRLNVDVARDSRLIALATGRDSMAMKAVALLTMFFLPATFLATLFAMPIFDWQAPSMAQVVAGPRFAFYWAVAAPLTLFVVGAWAVWTRFNFKKREKENAEARKLV